MSNINHNRPHLKYADNIKREIAELDARHKPERCASKTTATRITRCDGGERQITAKDKKVHILACSLLNHVRVHRDVSLCNKLIDTLSGARKTALMEWFCEFGEITTLNVRTNKQGSELLFRKHHVTKQVEAEAKPFWEFMPAPKRKIYNFRDEIMKIVIAAEKCLAKEVPDERDNVDPDMLNKLKSILRSMPS